MAIGGSEGTSPQVGDAAAEILRFIRGKWVLPLIHKDLMLRLKSPVLVANPKGGGTFHAYPATTIPDLCDAILEADQQGATTSRQQRTVNQALALTRGLARTGIIALVDEATGYQRIRDEQEVAAILKRYLADELQPWTRTFPFEFYELLYELRGWEEPRLDGKHGSQVARDAVDLVYTRLNKGIYEELQRRTPRLPTGELKHRLHRWFTPQHGHQKLLRHIEGVMALMRAVVRGSADWKEFKTLLNRSYEKFRDPNQLQLDLERKSQREIPGL